MQTFHVFLRQDGTVRVYFGTVSMMRLIESREYRLSHWTVEARTPIEATGKVMLKLYDQTQQPFQHVCVPEPCTRPHVDDPFNVESRLQYIEHEQPCGKMVTPEDADEHTASCRRCQDEEAYHALTGD